MRPLSSACILAIGLLSAVSIIGVNGHPARGDQNSQNQTQHHDLKYTFGAGEIPAGFFDAPETRGRKERQRQDYRACQDGSGGFCIPLGQCSQDLKPDKPSPNACGAGEECCFGLPPSNTPCKNKGGECTKQNCGNGPQIREGTECDHTNGEICCIWVF